MSFDSGARAELIDTHIDLDHDLDPFSKIVITRVPKVTDQHAIHIRTRGLQLSRMASLLTFMKF